MTLPTALITGGSGFVGQVLTRALLADGWEVHALGRASTRFANYAQSSPDVRCHVMPEDQVALGRLAAELRPTVCFHLASFFVAQHQPTDVLSLVESNVTFPVRLADALSDVGGVTLVNTGTAWQHRGGQSYAPADLYAATKQAFEDVLRFYADARRLNVRNVKLFDTYGPDDPRAKLFSLLISARRQNTCLRLSPGDQLVDLSHVADVATALRAAADAPAGSWASYAVSSGEPVTLRRLVEIFEEQTRGRIQVEWGATPYRGLEMFEPWNAGPPPPGWAPKVSLAQGIAEIWKAQEHQ